jgi:hypothetical protein
MNQVKAAKTISISILVLSGLFAAGCGDSPPVNPVPTDGSNPHVSGSPQERIKNIEADPTLTPAEKAQRIGVIKERNHIQ